MSVEPQSSAASGRRTIRVVLPAHLRTLARVSGEVALEIAGPVTQRSILDTLESRYPVLCGAIRDHVTKQRRPFVRFFACQEDLSHESPETPLPDLVVSGAEPFLIVGAIAGGSGDAPVECPRDSRRAGHAAERPPRNRSARSK